MLNSTAQCTDTALAVQFTSTQLYVNIWQRNKLQCIPLHTSNATTFLNIHHYREKPGVIKKVYLTLIHHLSVKSITISQHSPQNMLQSSTVSNKKFPASSSYIAIIFSSFFLFLTQAYCTENKLLSWLRLPLIHCISHASILAVCAKLTLIIFTFAQILDCIIMTRQWHLQHTLHVWWHS